MPIEHVTRAIAIDDLALVVSAYRWICDKCGRRDTFPDVPMPEGRSESDASRKGWRWHLEYDDSEICSCPMCCAKTDKRVAQGIEAGTAETRSGSVHESPVGNADAPTLSPPLNPAEQETERE